jgi:SpoVK/Ycf46/Vps4 family AAA+-type ATPase
MLRDMPLDPSFNLENVVRRTDGLSGSDLKEACRSTSTFGTRPAGEEY